MEDFNKTLEGFGRIHRYFEDSLPNDRIQPIIPLLIDENISIACHTRYFSSIRHHRSTIGFPFGPDVDPNGNLEKLSGSSYIHTEDNAVQYLEEKTEDGKKK